VKFRTAALVGAVLLLGSAVVLIAVHRRREDPPSTGPATHGSSSPSSPLPTPPPSRSPDGSEQARRKVQWIRELDPNRLPTQALDHLDEILDLERSVENEDPDTIQSLIEVLETGNLRARQLAALLVGRLKSDQVQAALLKSLRLDPAAPLQFALLWAVGIKEFARDESVELRRGFWKDRLAEITMAEGVPWSKAYEGQYDPKLLDESRPVPARSVVPHFGADPKLSRIDHAELRAAALDILARADTNTPVLKNLLLRLMNKQWFQDDCSEALMRTFLAETQKGFAERYLQLIGLNQTSEKVTQALLQYLSGSPDSALREKAVLALATKNSPSAQAWFVQLYAGAADFPEKRLAILGLGRYQDAASYPTLERAARQESNADLRRMAVNVLARYPSESSGPLLRQLVVQDGDARVRREILRMVGDQEKWGSSDARLLKSLAEADPDESVRSEARKWAQTVSAPK